MITLTLLGMVIVLTIILIIASYFLNQFKNGQDHYYKLFRREQKDCLRLEQEKRLLGSEMQKMDNCIIDLEKICSANLNSVHLQSKFHQREQTNANL